MRKIKRLFQGIGLCIYLLIVAPFIFMTFIHYAAGGFKKESVYSKMVYKYALLYELHNKIFTFPIWEDNFKNIPSFSGKILHLACGTGFGARIIETKGTHVIHMDMNLRFLLFGKAKKRMKNVVAGDVYHLPFKGEYIDRVILPVAFHHILNHELLFSEIKRVLKKDGKIIILEPVSVKKKRMSVMNSFHDGRIWILDQNSILKKIKPLLEKNKLQIESVRTFRPYSLQNYNIVYPMKDMILEISRKCA